MSEGAGDWSSPRPPRQVELSAIYCEVAFNRTGNRKFINLAIKLLERQISCRPADHPDCAMMLTWLANKLQARYESTNEIEDLSRSIELSARSLSLLHETHPSVSHRQQLLSNMGIRLGLRFNRHGDPEDLHAAIRNLTEAVETAPISERDRIVARCNLAQMYGSKFEWSGHSEDLDSAINHVTMALESTEALDPENPHRATVLSWLGVLLGQRFQQTGKLSDLHRAIDYAAGAVRLPSNNNMKKMRLLNNWALLLSKRFGHEGQLKDLDRAIEALEEAVNFAPADCPGDRLSYMNNLGTFLRHRFERTDSVKDLDRAVRLAIEVTETEVTDISSWQARLGNAATAFFARFKRLGGVNDLDRAVEFASKAISILPEGHRNNLAALNTLGLALYNRFEHFEYAGDTGEIDRAIKAMERACEQMAGDDPDLALVLSNMGNLLAARYNRTLLVDDLNRAIDLSREAVKKAAINYPGRAKLMNNLGIRLGHMFQRTGSLETLNESVELTDQAVSLTPPDHPDRARWLSNLGKRLIQRGTRTGAGDDTRRAMSILTLALDTTPADHIGWADTAHNLMVALVQGYTRLGTARFLDQAIEIAHSAINTMPESEPRRLAYMENQALVLVIRSTRSGVERRACIDDINRSVELLQYVTEATAKDDPEYGISLHRLGLSLRTRFQITRERNDLDKAVVAFEQASNILPGDHHLLTANYSSIGWLVRERAEMGEPCDRGRDREQAIMAYKQGIECEAGAPVSKISCAMEAARLLASHSRWNEARLVLEQAIGLLPRVTLRSLSNVDKEYQVAQLSGLGSMAAAISLNAGDPPESALQVLESARGVISSHLLDLRTDVSALEREHPALADRFRRVRDILDIPVDEFLSSSVGGGPESELQAKRKREAEQDYLETVDEIRRTPGFEQFLRPPSVAQMVAAAARGPIIALNMSTYRSDAFLITSKEIRLLSLADLDTTVASAMARAAQDRDRDPTHATLSRLSLSWLWKNVAKPCLDALGFTRVPPQDKIPHVWWIPSGTLSHLPLHAAGNYTGDRTDCVLDRVMSSYSSSIKSLIHGRQRQYQGQYDEAMALLVGMHSTPGQSRLPYASRELATVAALCPSLGLKPTHPSSRRRDEILKALQTCKVFHFAGHGMTHPLQPSESCLLLEDWGTHPLTVADLRDRWIGGNEPFLGYLSACSTGLNRADNLVDEAVHLASACQLAGFRHVVGTLWKVSDQYCLDVARTFYEALRQGMTDEGVCRALHKAVRAVRTEIANRSSYRIHESYIGDSRDVRIEQLVRQLSLNDGGGPLSGTEACPAEADLGEKPARDAELEDDDETQLAVFDPWIWAPYVHYGV